VQCLLSLMSATHEVEIKKMVVKGVPTQKFSETLCQPISQVWWFVPVIPAMWAAQVGGWGIGQHRQKHKTLSEN
jgi:hypothetical protein